MSWDNVKWFLIFIVTFIFIVYIANSEWYCENSLNGVYWKEECHIKYPEGHPNNDR